jgi:rRNA maturation endonuclease Nob1
VGLFREAGRLRRTVTGDDEAALRCRACDARVDARHDECPECGATEVVRTATAT